MAGGGGRSKSALGQGAGASSVTKLPPIGRRHHGSAGVPNDARSQNVLPTKKAWSGQTEISNEVREIVNIYKEVAKPDSKGLTKTDFRNLLFKTDPTDRRKKDSNLQNEVCSDMFRLLDKDGDGYVMLQDLLKHFVPPQQLKRMPAAFISSVMNRRKKVVVKSDTPRLSQSGIEEIRELHDLWLGYAEEVGPNQGRLDREAVIEILAGKYNAEFTWMEAREAADRIFAELPSNVDTISLGDMANHLQEVMFVSYAELSDGEVKKFKKHPRVDIDLGQPEPMEAVQLHRWPSNEKTKHAGALPASSSSKLKHASASTKPAKSSPKAGGVPSAAPLLGAATVTEESPAKTEVRPEKS